MRGDLARLLPEQGGFGAKLSDVLTVHGKAYFRSREAGASSYQGVVSSLVRMQMIALEQRCRSGHFFEIEIELSETFLSTSVCTDAQAISKWKTPTI
jgi:hypothetical protein